MSALILAIDPGISGAAAVVHVKGESARDVRPSPHR